MREEYDLSNAVRGRHAERYASGVKVRVDGLISDVSPENEFVKLDPDVKAAFPDSQSVNAALRVLMQAAKHLPKAS